MKNYSLTTYSYNELSESAKSKALMAVLGSGKYEMESWDAAVIQELKETLGGFNINVEEVFYDIEDGDGCDWYDLDEEYDGDVVPAMFVGDFVIDDNMRGSNDKYGFRESVLTVLSDLREEIGDVDASIVVSVDKGYVECRDNTSENIKMSFVIKNGKGEEVDFIKESPDGKVATRTIMMMSMETEINEALCLVLAEFYKNLYNVNYQLNGAEGVLSRLESGDLQDVEFLKNGQVMDFDRDLLDA